MNKNLKAIIVGVLNGLIILSIAFNSGFPSAQSALAVEDRNLAIPYNIVFEGDSLTADGTYSNKVMRMIDLYVRTENIAHNVATAAQTLYPTMSNDAPSQVDSNYVSTRYKNIAVLWAGTNDLYYNKSTCLAAQLQPEHL